MSQRHKKLNAELESSDLTLMDRETRTMELHEVNEAIGNRSDELQEIEEERITDEVKTNPKGFCSYPNCNTKLKFSVCPLKEGKHFYSGPKKMAEILNKFWKFSILQNYLTSPLLTKT